eukprot:228601_1
MNNAISMSMSTPIQNINININNNKSYEIKESVCVETDEDEIKITDNDLILAQDEMDIDEQNEKYNTMFGRQNSEFNTQRDETKGDETFSLVNEWSRADPPIVFLNASHIVKISKPSLKTDLDFELKNGEQSYTLLCSDLDECKHPDAEEWKLVQKTNPLEHLKWESYNFKKEDEIRRQNVKRSKLEVDCMEKQKIKLRLILTLCGGYKTFDKKENKYIAVRDEMERKKLVDRLYEKHKDYVLTFDNILKIVAVFFKVKSGIPVLIMGENGCGKTKLLEYMASVLQLDMISVDVHRGYNIDDLSYDISKAQERAMANEHTAVLLFLDRINTSAEIASFKEIICDHCFKGEQLPENLIIIGALNPYRRRKNK